MVHIRVFKEDNASIRMKTFETLVVVLAENLSASFAHAASTGLNRRIIIPLECLAGAGISAAQKVFS